MAAIAVIFCALWMSLLSPLLAEPRVAFEDMGDFHSYHTDDKSGPILILFGGANIEIERYSLLAKALMNTFPSGAVIIAKFTANMANPLQSKSRVATILDALEQSGWREPNQKAYLMGHSQGGMMAYQLVESFDLKGLILLGSYLPRTIALSSPYTLDQYPKPILTLGAELDGLTGIHYIAREYKDAKRYQENAPTYDYSHEVWLLPGLNHMQFVDDGYLKGDIPSEVSLDKAHTAIADAIHTFVNVQEQGMRITTELQQKVQRYRFKASELLEPIFKAELLDQTICLESQQLISGLNQESKLAIEATAFDNFLKFVLAKAAFKDDESGQRLVVPFYEERPMNLTDVSLYNSLAPETIACKMRSKESIFQSLDLSYDAADDRLNCADINKVLAERVLSLLSPDRAARLEAKGVKLDFELVSLTTGIEWLSSFFGFKKVDANHWMIKTQELKTSVDSKPEAFAGAHYCKIMPAARLMHWALVQSLKYE